jgi:hypothetical protein
MLPEVNVLSACACAVDPELNSEESAVNGSRNIKINYGISHFKILQKCSSAIQHNAFLSLVLGE